jgi:serine/threonine protein kinase
MEDAVESVEEVDQGAIGVPDISELARMTERSEEDLRADLEDDGILNFSAGSDANEPDDGSLDTSRFTRIHKLRAEGGMAVVHLAKDKSTGEQVIWKQAAPHRKLSTKEANAALANEIEVLAKLDHPRAPGFVESGHVEDDDGESVLVLIMEHIEGTSLDAEMKTFIGRGMRQGLDHAVGTVLQCCDALEHMADLEPPLYHRDIKPHNIITHPSRGAVLIDFGLAKEVVAGSGMSLSAGAHTAGWSPPERERAQTGPYTDVYSLGQVLWHMLTNEHAGIYSKDQHVKAITEAGHPEWLAELVNRATIPVPVGDRIQTVAEFRIRLENEGELP